MNSETSKNQRYIKMHNSKLVLNIIRDMRPISRADIAKQVNMSPTSITRIVTELIESGLVRETDTFTGGMGRHATQLDIVEGGIYTAGIHIDADRVRLCVLNFASKIVCTQDCSLCAVDYDPKSFVDRLFRTYRALLEENGIDAERVVGVGASIIGIVSPESGQVVFAPSLGWRGVALAGIVKEAFAMPVVIENDVKCAVVGETLAGGRPSLRDTVFLSIGMGVGSAFIFERRVIRGKNNAAGEIGHITLDPDGEMCACGRRGCLQTFIGQGAILKRARAAEPEIAGIDDFLRYRASGVAWAESLFESTCRYIAIAINYCACLFNPECIIVGGSLINRYPSFYKRAMDLFPEVAYQPILADTQIMREQCGGNAGVIGAANNAQNYFLKHRFRA